MSALLDAEAAAAETAVGDGRGPVQASIPREIEAARLRARAGGVESNAVGNGGRRAVATAVAWHALGKSGGR